MKSMRAMFSATLLALVFGLAASGLISNGAASLFQAVGPTAAQAAPALQAPVTAPASDVQVPVVDASGVVSKANPAVVTVVNRMSGGTATGSGFIIDQQGHIVTNNHVVAGERSLQVIFYDGTQATAQLVGTDPADDIGVIQVGGTLPGVVAWGDSAQLQAGQPVVAIGSALGDLRNTVTVGVVSGLNRQVDGNSSQTGGMIQTDAAINHGNSGGPLLDMSAEVIGVNTLVLRDGSAGDQAEGLGFAIPSNTAHTIADQLIAQGGGQGSTQPSPSQPSPSQPGSGARAYLGVTYQTLTPATAAGLGLNGLDGAYLSSVQAGSPAATAGLQAGDVLTAVDGQALDANHTLQASLQAHQPGDRVAFQVLRTTSGAQGTVTVTLGTHP